MLGWGLRVRGPRGGGMHSLPAALHLHPFMAKLALSNTTLLHTRAVSLPRCHPSPCDSITWGSGGPQSPCCVPSGHTCHLLAAICCHQCWKSREGDGCTVLSCAQHRSSCCAPPPCVGDMGSPAHALLCPQWLRGHSWHCVAVVLLPTLGDGSDLSVGMGCSRDAVGML